MGSETRYFRDDEKLGTSQTTTGDYKGVEVIWQLAYGIKVYVDDVCISGAIPVAIIPVPPFPPSETDGTWACPVQANAGIIKVEVYACTAIGTDLLLIETFVTTDSVKLDAATWTVHYFGYEDVEVIPSVIYFFYGKNTRPARITNFTWSAVAAMISKRLLVGVGL